jgi:hypothetical protein
VDETHEVYGETRRAGSRLRHALLLAWLVGWVLVFGFLPPHGEASSAPDALEVSGDEIPYNGSRVIKCLNDLFIRRALCSTKHKFEVS